MSEVIKTRVLCVVDAVERIAGRLEEIEEPARSYISDQLLKISKYVMDISEEVAKV